MPRFATSKVLHIAGGAIVLSVSIATAQAAPDFSFGNNATGWVSVGTDWLPGSSGPPPVTFDPAHPYVPNGSGAQPTFRVADLSNPNLTEFAKSELKKSNDMVLDGFAMYAREARCWATGTPAYLLNPAQPTFILQRPEKVTMIWQMDHQVRHIYLDIPHSTNPKPSWYGESVGHYEGDTLVVDTIGQNSKTFIDNYRTPHSEKLHVVERFRMIDNGQGLEANVTIEDPEVLKQPWHLVHRWRKADGTLVESRCADGESNNPFEQRVEPLPTAEKPDF